MRRRQLTTNKSKERNDLQLRKEFEKRSEDNAAACHILHNNENLWKHVGGPDVETLFRPSEEALAKVRECCEDVQSIKARDDRDGMTDSCCTQYCRPLSILRPLSFPLTSVTFSTLPLSTHLAASHVAHCDICSSLSFKDIVAAYFDPQHHQEFANEIQTAVELLKSLEWEEIRKEKFSITPIVIFENFVRLAESMISREAAEKQRRQQWLAEAAEEVPEQDEGTIPLSINTADKYGVDLEEFKMKTGKKPLHWQSLEFVASLPCLPGGLHLPL